MENTEKKFDKKGKHLEITLKKKAVPPPKPKAEGIPPGTKQTDLPASMRRMPVNPKYMA